MDHGYAKSELGAISREVVVVRPIRIPLDLKSQEVRSRSPEIYKNLYSLSKVFNCQSSCKYQVSKSEHFQVNVLVFRVVFSYQLFQAVHF